MKNVTSRLKNEKVSLVYHLYHFTISVVVSMKNQNLFANCFQLN